MEQQQENTGQVTDSTTQIISLLRNIELKIDALTRKVDELDRRLDWQEAAIDTLCESTDGIHRLTLETDSPGSSSTELADGALSSGNLGNLTNRTI